MIEELSVVLLCVSYHYFKKMAQIEKHAHASVVLGATWTVNIGLTSLYCRA